MAAADYYTQVYTMFVGYFGRPPAKAGLDYYAGQVNAAGGKLDVVIDDFFKSAESQAFFAGKTIEQQVHQIFQNLFGRDAAPSGLSYWTDMISTGKVALAQAAYTIAFNAAAADTAILTAKVDSAKLWVSGLDTFTETQVFSSSAGLAAGRNFLKTITSSTPATQTAVDAALKSMVDGTVTATFTLTSGVDQADTTGSSKNGGLIPSDFKFTAGNEVVSAAASTLNTTDVLTDGSTSDADVLNVTDTGGAVVSASITNIETINMDVKTTNGGLSMTNVTGAKVVNFNTSAGASLVNVNPTAAPKIGLSGDHDLFVKVTTLAGTTAAGTAETLNFFIKNAIPTATTIAGINLGSTVAGSLETVNLESAGTAKNYLWVRGYTGANSIGTANVTGAADLEVRAVAALWNGMELNATSHTGALTVVGEFDGGATTVGLNAEKFSGVDQYTIRDSKTTAGATAFGLYNIATGVTVRIAEDVEASSIITVKGADTGSADSVNLSLQNRASVATDVDVAGLTVNNVETIKLSSNGAPTTGAAGDQQNSVAALNADKLTTLTINGASNTKLTLGANSAATALMVDGSAAAGKLELSAAAVTTGTTRTVTLKGGTNDDALTGSATVGVKNVFDLSAGGKDVVNVVLGDTNDEIVGFANGHKIALGASAGSFVNGLSATEISAAEQATIEAAATLADAASAAAGAVTVYTANTAVLFSYQGNQYVLMDDATFGAYNAASDAIIKVAGLSGTSAFDAGTFLFA